MWHCPVCGKEHSEGFVCGDCGFDLSRDYEGNRTLSPLRSHGKSISARRAAWRERQTGASVPEILSCPQCGRNDFQFSIPDRQFICLSCGSKRPLSDVLPVKVPHRPAPTRRAFSGATIAAGLYHTVALKSDGTVAAVGSNDYGQCDVTDWTDIIAIAAGAYHTVGLRVDGTVVAAGPNGQCNVHQWTDIVAIAAGGCHTVGLKSNGTVLAVGDLESGVSYVNSWSDIVAISTGLDQIVGLRADGTVAAVGFRRATMRYISTWTDIVTIAAGGLQTIGLKADCSVKRDGGLLEHKPGYRETMDDANTWKCITAIAACSEGTIVLKADGSAVAAALPWDVSGWRDIVAIAVNDYHAVGLRADGTLVAVGSNDTGQCDVQGLSHIKLPPSNRMV